MAAPEGRVQAGLRWIGLAVIWGRGCQTSELKMQLDHQGCSGSQAEDPAVGHGRMRGGLFGEAESCCATLRERRRDQSPRRAEQEGPCR